MNTTFEEILSYTVREEMISILAPDIEKWTGSVHEKALRRAEIKKLADIILNLPQKGQEILLGRYAFDLTPENVEIIYGISEADLRRGFFERQLAHEMGLGAGERIAESSLYKACRMAMYSLTEDNSEQKKQKNIILIFAKTAAAIFIVGLLSFGTAMGVNAEFRDAVSKWFIETFSEYSIFRLENDKTTNTILYEYTLGYIPDRFTYTGVEKYDEIITFTCEDAEGNYLSIDIEQPGENDYVDTENTTMELLDFNGAEARYYYKEDYSILVTTIDGYALYITGPVTKEEIMKIADGIQR